MSLEHDAITRALKTAPNITEAARQLGASRRTLQNRMRHYGIPRGKAGRPRELLPYGGSSFIEIAAVSGVLVGLVALLGKWMRDKEPTVAGADVRGNIYIHGTDILGSF